MTYYKKYLFVKKDMELKVTYPMELSHRICNETVICFSAHPGRKLSPSIL
jgi:hypothetical protein